MERSRTAARIVIGAWLVVVLAAAAVEAAIALGWLDVGPLPGQDPGVRDLLTPLATVALLGGALALGLAALAGDATVRRLGSVPGLAAVPLAAAALLLAFTFSYDAYYAPSLRRYATNIPTSLVVGLVVAAVVVAAALRTPALRRPALLAAGVLLFAVCFAMVAGGGH